MSSKNTLFNLLEEEWIPVIYNNGERRRVGILKAFEDAEKIRAIAISNPMDRFAVLRFLLSLVYWSAGNPDSSNPPASSKDLKKRLDDKLNCDPRLKNRFNLLGEPPRFYQEPGLSRRKTICELIHEIPKGNNFWHFRHSIDGENGLCLPCCALGILRVPVFALSGLPNLMAGINGPPPVYVIRLGNSLFHTLLANWQPHQNIGLPAYDPEYKPENSSAQSIPLLDGLTRPARKIWLHTPTKNGICFGCGESVEQLIFECDYETAGKQENPVWRDPNVLYDIPDPGSVSKKSKKQAPTQTRQSLKAPNFFGKSEFTTDRPWDKLVNFLNSNGWLKPHPFTKALFVVSFVSDKAKNVDVWEKIIPLPDKQPPAHISDVLNSFQEETKSHYNKIYNLLSPRKSGNVQVRDRRNEALIKSMLFSIYPHIHRHILSQLNHWLFMDMNELNSFLRNIYAPFMEAVSSAIVPGNTTDAFENRHRLYFTIPDLTRHNPQNHKTPENIDQDQQ